MRRTAQTAGRARTHGLWPAVIQPYSALVYVLVSTFIIHVITLITSHLLTQEG